MQRLAAWFRNFFDVRPGEYGRTFFMSLYLLLVLLAALLGLGLLTAGFVWVCHLRVLFICGRINRNGPLPLPFHARGDQRIGRGRAGCPADSRAGRPSEARCKDFSLSGQVGPSGELVREGKPQV